MPGCSRRRSRVALQALVLSAFLVVSGASPITATTAPEPGPTPGSGSAAARPVGVGARPVGTGGFVLPVAGPPVVLTGFRPPASRYGPGHRGVDLASPTGGPVLAAGTGVVVFAGLLAGRGVVSIDHPAGLRTTYEAVVSTMRAGDRVTIGQQIGTLGAGHGSCAPASCLHWGARLPDGSYIDPMGLLTGLKVRLLPWVR